MTQPPSARLPGTLQQLEPPLLQEPKAFVPQCQGCQGKREAATPRWDPGLATPPAGLPAKPNIRALHSRQSQASSKSRGPRVRWPPNSDLEC